LPSLPWTRLVGREPSMPLNEWIVIGIGFPCVVWIGQRMASTASRLSDITTRQIENLVSGDIISPLSWEAFYIIAASQLKEKKRAASLVRPNARYVRRRWFARESWPLGESQLRSDCNWLWNWTTDRDRWDRPSRRECCRTGSSGCRRNRECFQPSDRAHLITIWLCQYAGDADEVRTRSGSDGVSLNPGDIIASTLPGRYRSRYWLHDRSFPILTGSKRGRCWLRSVPGAVAMGSATALNHWFIFPLNQWTDDSMNQFPTQVEVSMLPVIHAVPSQMRQLFQNLISNAVKFAKKNEAPVTINSNLILY